METVKCILETALLTSQKPINVNELKKLFDGEFDDRTVNVLLDELRTDWDKKGLELISVSSGWRFQSKIQYSHYLQKLQTEKTSRYSRAVMETLAIIAYRQPVTRGDIEKIRGVAVSSHIIKILEERNWILSLGQRESIGRPTLLGTSKKFLDDLGLISLEELPSISNFETDLDSKLIDSEKVNYEGK
jgi:segregation and condensation protein B